MEGKTFALRMFLSVGWTAVASPVLAEAVGQVGVPNTSGGVVISCSNPTRILSVVRDDDATRVVQSGPEGPIWQTRLPAMQGQFDEFWLSPRGDAAVIVVSHAQGRAFLVSPAFNDIAIPDGHVAAVDFQGDRALVATVGDTGVRVQVYSVRTGALIGDTTFSDLVEVSADRSFYIRLAADGRAYYYVRAGGPGAVGGVVLRDVVSGAAHLPSLAQGDGVVPVGHIDDVRMDSKHQGSVVINRTLYTLSGSGLLAVPVPAAIGRPRSVVESSGTRLQAVTGSEGWGVRDRTTGRWLIAERRLSKRLYPYGHLLAVEDRSGDSRGVRTFDLTGGRARLVAEIDAGSLDGKVPHCVNAHGAMKFQGGKFKWVRAEPVTPK